MSSSIKPSSNHSESSLGASNCAIKSQHPLETASVPGLTTSEEDSDQSSAKQQQYDKYDSILSQRIAYGVNKERSKSEKVRGGSITDVEAIKHDAH